MRTETVKTAVRGNFPKKEPRPACKVNTETIVKTRAPYTGGRSTPEGKWEALFRGATEGDCFEMAPEDTTRAEAALRTWMRKKGIEGIVRRKSRCEDGKGRVWLLKVFKKVGAA